MQVDLIRRYTDALSVGNVPAYFVGDARVAWHYRPDTELFLVGRGLFDNGHREFAGAESVSTCIRSEVYAGVTIRR